MDLPKEIKQLTTCTSHSKTNRLLLKMTESGSTSKTQTTIPLSWRHTLLLRFLYSKRVEYSEITRLG